MTIVFEADRRFNRRPGIHRGRRMTRVWWLWFAVAWVHYPFEELVTAPHVWVDR